MAQDVEALLPLDPPCLERMPSCSTLGGEGKQQQALQDDNVLMARNRTSTPQTGHSLTNVPVDNQICDVLSRQGMSLRPQMIVGCTPQMSEVLIFFPFMLHGSGAPSFSLGEAD